jgi:ArsR family transcriptional regulator, lead/cadmium/zinc/bismuth-responsive transcriptional repressor
MTVGKDTCEIQSVHGEKVARVKSALEDEDLLRLAEIFKAMGDGTRLKILHALSQEELCVCDLVEVLEVSQSAVSHQLRVLRNLRLVKFRKVGKMAYYSLDDQHVSALLVQGLNHLRHK